MSTSLYQLSVESYLQSLRALDGILQKAEEHCAKAGNHPDDLLKLRLCDDMLPMQFQILSVLWQSVGVIAALRSGVFTPPAKSDPLTFVQVRAKVHEAIKDLAALDQHDINSLSGKSVVFKLGGNDIPFTAEDFVLSFSLPNLYFHATTAYDLLRKEGLNLGKRDFLGRLKTVQ